MKQPLRESSAYEHGRADAAAGKPMLTAATFARRFRRYDLTASRYSTTGVRAYYVRGYETYVSEHSVVTLLERCAPQLGRRS